jgi:hypothetical protein
MMHMRPAMPETETDRAAYGTRGIMVAGADISDDAGTCRITASHAD